MSMEHQTQRPRTQTKEQMRMYRLLPLRHINNNPDEIRLLSILPATDLQSPVECRLEVFSHGIYPGYTALSYAWGANTQRQSVHVNERDFPVTDNLGVALRRLRKPSGRRRIWVDATCINQADLSERSSQVAIMGRIFGRATVVLIWLGDPTLLCLGNASNVDTMKWDGQSEVKFVDGSMEQEAFSMLMNCILTVRPSWWQRAWVLQEVVAAQGPLVVAFGKFQMSWQQLVSAPFSILQHNELKKLSDQPGRDGFVQALENIDAIKMDYGRNEVSLMSTLLRTRHSVASEPKDKIFSILAIIRPQELRWIRPDYSQSLSKVFGNATFAVLKTRGDLDALVLVKLATVLWCPTGTCRYRFRDLVRAIRWRRDIGWPPSPWIEDYALTCSHLVSYVITDHRKARVSLMDVALGCSGFVLDFIVAGAPCSARPQGCSAETPTLARVDHHDAQLTLAGKALVFLLSLELSQGMSVELGPGLSMFGELILRESRELRSRSSGQGIVPTLDRDLITANEFLRFSPKTDEEEATPGYASKNRSLYVALSTLCKMGTIRETSEEVLSLLEVSNEFVELTRANESPWTFLAFWYNSLAFRLKRQPPLKAFRRQRDLINNMWSQFFDCRWECGPVTGCSSDAARHARHEKPQGAPHWEDYFRHVASDEPNSLYCTRGGLLGWAAGGVRAGDIVTVLDGASAPVVLRPRGTQYEFCGFTYMDAPWPIAKSELTESDFVLC